MPRIRRWHPVSHDLNRDREFQALLAFHDRMGYVWLEMLAEADKNEGKVKGTAREVAEDLGWIVSKKRPTWGGRKILEAIPFMLEKCWITDTGKGHFLVINYLDYHPRREQASSREETKQFPPSLLPSLPPKDRPLRGLVPRPELTPTELMEAWNEVCATEGLPRIEQHTNGRKAKARARLKTFPKSEFWSKVLNGIIESDYLMGRKRKEGDTWKPDFDWLVKNDETPAKVMEGKYE